MIYTTMRSTAMLFLVLGTKLLTESMSINNYFRLINDVHRYYRTSCVIFVRSSNYDLNTTTLVHTWSHEFSRQRVMTMTITFSDLTNKYNKYRKNVIQPLFVVALDTEETMDEFAKTTRSIKPISFPIWLVIFLQRPGNPLEEYCKHPTDNVFNVDFSTQMLILCYARPILVEWYAIRDNRTRTSDLALWSPDKGLLLRAQKNLYARRNMLGDIVRVASVNNSPLLSLNNGTFSGFFGLVLVELSKVMNFTVEILDPVKVFGGWSHRKKMWTGAIGQLVANEADIGVSAFTVTTHRQKVVDFTIPLIRSQNRLYFHQPDTSYVHWSLYLRAFSLGIWTTIIIIITIASILLTIIKTKGYFSINLMFENYIKVWGIYCQQGLSKFPRKSSLRLAFLSIYLSSIVIVAIYSASLFSLLAFTNGKLPFSTLEDFIKDDSYKLLVLKDSVDYYIPTDYKDPVFLQMYKLLEDEKYLPLTLLKGFEQICEKRNKLAFYVTAVFQQSINIYIPCRVTYIDTGRIDNLAIATTKGNPYIGFMNYHLQRFQLNGIMSKLRNKYIMKNLRYILLSGEVEVVDIAPILTMLVTTMVLALFILIIEKAYYSFKTRSKNNQLFVKKVSYNLDVRRKNQLRKRNNERNLKLQGFYDMRSIEYWTSKKNLVKNMS